MDAPNDKLVSFLARDADACGESGRPCPDENALAALEAGLASVGERDELLRHIQHCATCRRRIAQILTDWPADLVIPPTLARAPDGRQARGGEAEAHSSPIRTGSKLDLENEGVTLRRRSGKINSRRLALAAAVVLAVTATWIYYPGSDSTAILGEPIARLTNSGGIGIVTRHTLSAESRTGETAAIERLVADLTLKANDAPEDADLWHALGRAQARLAQFDRAIDSLKRAAAIRPDDAGVQNALGMAQYRAKQYREASAAFARAIALDEARADYHLNAALTLEELQQIDEAIAQWQRFLELAPDDPAAKEVRRWLAILNGS